MDTLSPISIKKINQSNDFMNSMLELNITGKNVDNTVINTIRRTILTHIPIYVYDNIEITKNTSVFDNNYIKLRLKNIPVIGIKTKTNIYKEKTTDDDEDLYIMDDTGIAPDDTDINTDSLNEMSIYIDKINTGIDIITVGTNDCSFYYQGKQIKNPYKVNIPIIKLQPKQEIKMTAITKLGIEKMNSIYSPVSVCMFKKNKDNDFNFTLESRGQLTENEILNYSIDNILQVLDNVEELVKEIDNKELKGIIEVNNMEHTVGNLIATGFTLHKDVKYGCYNMPHLLDNKINIKYELKKNNINNVLMDIVNYYRKLFKSIKFTT